MAHITSTLPSTVPHTLRVERRGSVFIIPVSNDQLERIVRTKRHRELVAKYEAEDIVLRLENHTWLERITVHADTRQIGALLIQSLGIQRPAPSSHGEQDLRCEYCQKENGIFADCVSLEGKLSGCGNCKRAARENECKLPRMDPQLFAALKRSRERLNGLRPQPNYTPRQHVALLTPPRRPSGYQEWNGMTKVYNDDGTRRYEYPEPPQPDGTYLGDAGDAGPYYSNPGQPSTYWEPYHDSYQPQEQSKQDEQDMSFALSEPTRKLALKQGDINNSTPSFEEYYGTQQVQQYPGAMGMNPSYSQPYGNQQIQQHPGATGMSSFTYQPYGTRQAQQYPGTMGMNTLYSQTYGSQQDQQPIGAMSMGPSKYQSLGTPMTYSPARTSQAQQQAGFSTSLYANDSQAQQQNQNTLQSGPPTKRRRSRRNSSFNFNDPIEQQDYGPLVLPDQQAEKPYVFGVARKQSLAARLHNQGIDSDTMASNVSNSLQPRQSAQSGGYGAQGFYEDNPHLHKTLPKKRGLYDSSGSYIPECLRDPQVKTGSGLSGTGPEYENHRAMYENLFTDRGPPDWSTIPEPGYSVLTAPRPISTMSVHNPEYLALLDPALFTDTTGADCIRAAEEEKAKKAKQATVQDEEDV